MLNNKEDTQAFRRRLQWCIRRVGSVYEFSKRSGIGRSTLRSYLRTAEPTRPFIARIAECANVSVDWLVTGKAEFAPIGEYDEVANSKRDRDG